jgi:hypothetical protein
MYLRLVSVSNKNPLSYWLNFLETGSMRVQINSLQLTRESWQQGGMRDLDKCQATARNFQAVGITPRLDFGIFSNNLFLVPTVLQLLVP